jgi:tetratricopeptide (TPR) repeat protein
MRNTNRPTEKSALGRVRDLLSRRGGGPGSRPYVDAADRVRVLATRAAAFHEEQGRVIPAHVQAVLDGTSTESRIAVPHTITLQATRPMARWVYAAAASGFLFVGAGGGWFIAHRGNAGGPPIVEEHRIAGDPSARAKVPAAGIAAGGVAAAQTPNRDARFKDAYAAGIALMGPGTYEKAVVAFTRALEFQPGNLDALYNRGSCLMNLSRHAEAAEDFTRVIAGDTQKRSIIPGDRRIRAYYNRAASFMNLEKLSEAEKDFTVVIDQAASRDPLRMKALQNRSQVRNALGDLQGAEGDRQAAITLADKV